MSEGKSKVVYVAGAMRKKQWFNFPAFDAARDRLVRLGFGVLSPADMDRAEGFCPYKYADKLGIPSDEIDWSVIPATFDLDAATERDNETIDKADAIYVIHDGIAESRGGMAEIERGMKVGKVIIFDTMDDAAILKALGVEMVQAEARTLYPSLTTERAAREMSSEMFARLSAAGRTAEDSAVDPKILSDHILRTTRIVLNGCGIPPSLNPPRYTEREGVLDEAKKLICGDRNASYGPPTQDFRRSADMMTALFSYKLKDGERFKSSDVAWIITLVKASRAQHSPKRDNYVDAAGYMGCGWECEAEEVKNK